MRIAQLDFSILSKDLLKSKNFKIKEGTMKIKTNYLKRVISLALATTMLVTIVPPRVFAQDTETKTDALSSATYYRKANWEARIKDKSRWPVGDNQRLVRVTT